jgi:hypothetical protein
MSDKFLGTGYSNVSLTNGSQPIYAATLSALNLQTGMAVKTNNVAQLTSSNLEISDVNGLQEALDAGGGSTKTINIVDAIENVSTSFKGDIIPSANIAYDLGEGGDAFRDIYTTRVLSANGLSSIDISDTKTTLNRPLDLSSNRITNVSEPIDDTDAATRAYVNNNTTQVGNTELLYLNRSVPSDSPPYYQAGTSLTSIGQINDYYNLIYGPGTSQILLSFITNASYPNVDTIPQGVWAFHLYASINSVVSPTYINLDMLKISSLGVETLLYTTANSSPITSTDVNNPQRLVISLAIPNTPIAKTDRLLFRIFGTKSDNIDKILDIAFEGNNYYSYIATTFTGLESYVVGPTNETLDSQVCVFNGTSGKNIKNTQVLINPIGTISNVNDISTTVHSSINTELTTLQTKTQYQTTPTLNTTTFTGTVQGDSIKKSGGTNLQYLMADGSSLQYSANSGNSNFYLYKSHTNTPTPPPDPGFVYYNNAVQSLATIIYISHKTDDNIDIEVFFNNLSTLNEVYLQKKTLSDNFIKYNITGLPTITTGSHIQIPVSSASFGGTGQTSFGVNEPILVSFFTNTIETDTRITALETKTQNQTGVLNTTTYTGNIESDSTTIKNGSIDIYKVEGVLKNVIDGLKYGFISLRLSLRKLAINATYSVNVTDALSNTIDIGFDANGITDYVVFSTLQEPVYVNTWYSQSAGGYNFTGLAGTLGVKPRLIFTLINTKRVPSIVFNNSGFVSTATCTELGLDNSNHATMITMKSTTTNTNVMFLTGGKKTTGPSGQFEGNEIHTNPPGFGCRVIEDSTVYADFGTFGQFTDQQWHVLVSGSQSLNAVGRGDAVSTVATTSSQNITNNVFQIGLRGDNDFPFYGEMAEVMIFPFYWITDGGGYEQYWQDTVVYNSTGFQPKNVEIISGQDILMTAQNLNLDVANKTSFLTGDVDLLNTGRVQISNGGTCDISPTGNLTLKTCSVDGILTTRGVTSTVGNVSFNGVGNFDINQTGTCTINPTSTLTLKGFTSTGNILMSNNQIASLADPTDPSDACNKYYADTKMSGAGTFVTNESIVVFNGTGGKTIKQASAKVVGTSILPFTAGTGSVGEFLIPFNQIHTNSITTGGLLPRVATTNDIGSSLVPFKDVYATRVTGIAVPTISTDATSKEYVDTAVFEAFRWGTFMITFTSAAALTPSSAYMPTSGLTHLGGSTAIVAQVLTSPLTKIFKVASNVSSTSEGGRSGYIGSSTFPTLFPKIGFNYNVAFGIGDANTTTTAVTQFFFGLNTTVTIPTWNSTSGPNTTASIMGIGHDLGDTFLSWYSRGTTTGSKIATSFLASTPSLYWLNLNIYNPIGSNNVFLTLKDELTGLTSTQTFSFSAGSPTGAILQSVRVYPIHMRAMAVVGGITGSATTHLARFQLSLK